MHCAASHGHLDAIEKLRQAGAQVSVRANDGRTPMHCAASHGHLDAIKALRQAGEDVGGILLNGKERCNYNCKYFIWIVVQVYFQRIDTGSYHKIPDKGISFVPSNYPTTLVASTPFLVASSPPDPVTLHNPTQAFIAEISNASYATTIRNHMRRLSGISE